MLVPLLLDLQSTGTPPSIISQPSSVSAQPGVSVTFNVVALGSTPLVYQWYKNGSAITSATGASYTTPPLVYPADNGAVYFVSVANSAGLVNSNQITVTVIVPSANTQLPTTSGTVGQTVFRTRNIVDMAFRRAGKAPQEVGGEDLQVALDNLYLLLLNMSNKNIVLSCIERDLLPLYQGQNTVPCPVGTVDILNVNVRDLQILSGTASSSEGLAANAFDRDPLTSCTETAPGGTITLNFASPTNVTQIGILPSAVGTWNVVVETSPDGTVWSPVYSNSTLAVTSGQWNWVDIDNPISTLASATLNAITNIRLRAVSPTVLNVAEFVVANTPSEIPMTLINRDDYTSLPNRDFQAKPVEYWYNRQINPPQLWIWPAPDGYSVFRQLVLYRKRQIQDVGTLTQIIELPQRWFDPVIWMLAFNLCLSIKDVDPGRLQSITPLGQSVIKDAWDGETDRAAMVIAPNITPYTA